MKRELWRNFITIEDVIYLNENCGMTVELNDGKLIAAHFTEKEDK